MMPRTLAAVASELDARLVGDDTKFHQVGIDSRKIHNGALFVAIEGERLDGNDYVAHAHARGAAGALVSRQIEVPLPQLKVPDTRVALGHMARA